VAKDPTIGAELTWWANCLGVTGPAFDSYMTLRGLRTLVPRLQLQQQNTSELVHFLQQQPLVSKLYYPGLTDHPGHAIAKAQQSGFGAMCSFDLAAPIAALPLFFASLRLFTLAQSLGGIESLICHPGSMTHASMSATAQHTAGISPTLIRLSIGIEAVEDLIADLQNGFHAVANWLASEQNSNNTLRANNKAVATDKTNQQCRLNPAFSAMW
jgi:cystathionine gamma-synthase